MELCVFFIKFPKNSCHRHGTVPCLITEIEMSAFDSCISLTSLTLPATVTQISSGAFRNSGLISITFPAGLSRIGVGAFSNSSLQEIVFTGNAPMFQNENGFSGVTATAYYPESNTTWTPECLKNYGGSLTWVAY